MHLSSCVCRKLRLLVVATLVISALAAGPALANGPTPKPTGYEQCWVTPNPLLNGTPYTVWGSGFAPGILVDVLIMDQYLGRWLMSQVGADGTFNGTGTGGFVYLGTKDVSVYNPLAKGKQTALAQCSFDVAPW